MSTWRPQASIDTLKKRAILIQKIRSFFYKRDYLEIETPILASHGVTDVYLKNLESKIFDKTYYLQTSPEYHMKRLLAAGSGPIFQIAKAFRDDELGRLHNIEFTMLEWYRPGMNYNQLMNEVDDLLHLFLTYKKSTRLTYRQLFERFVGFNPHEVSIRELQQCCHRFKQSGVLAADEQDKDQYLFLILSQVIEPQLVQFDEPVFIYEFPTSQAALATIHNNVAQRFEVYYKGIELANGFNELTCPEKQRDRFLLDCLKRKSLGLPEKAIDEYFIQALGEGLPQCSGVALGLDRLIMVSLDKKAINQVMSFTLENA